MKTSTLTSFFAVSLALPVALFAEDRKSSTPADSGSASATARQSGSTSGSATSTSAGLVLHNGSPYIVRNNQATKLDSTTLRPGQILTSEGNVVDIPEGISGLNRLNANVADSGSASATARQSGSVSGGATGQNTQDGFILKDGVPHIVRNGKATAVDTSSLKSGQILTTDGQVRPIPEGVTGLDKTGAETSSNSSDANRGNTTSSDTNRTNSTKSSGTSANRGSSVDSTQSPSNSSSTNRTNTTTTDTPASTGQSAGSNSNSNSNPSR